MFHTLRPYDMLNWSAHAQSPCNDDPPTCTASFEKKTLFPQPHDILVQQIRAGDQGTSVSGQALR